jgi:peptidoglycan/LPS O-acetylase OafA/YrhL
MQERRFDIDWLRIFLIFSVFLYHIGMFFNGWGWHLKNNVQVTSIHPLMTFLHYWRMPMLFFISGVGTYFALGTRGTWRYVGERHKRLFIPLVFGILILVAPQVYLERADQYKNYFDFYPHFFEGSYPKGNFSWHHLWFICYLLIFSMLALPLFLLMRKYGIRVYQFLEKMLQMKGGFALLFLPVLVSQIILLPHFHNETHDLTHDWAHFTFYFFFFIYGFVLLSDKKLTNCIFQQRHINLVLGILASVAMFHLTPLFAKEGARNISWELNRMLMSWFLPLAVFGYAQKYLNFDNKWRKYLNEAIYPIYLLHQPIILIIGYQLMNLQMGVLTKAIIMLVSASIAVFLLYMLIWRFNALRFIFGMHPRKRKDLVASVDMGETKAA